MQSHIHTGCGKKRTLSQDEWLKRLRDESKTKKMFQFGHCPNWGGGLPLPEFFAPFFYLRKKSRQWSRRRKESVKLPELGGGGGGLANSGNARIETFFLFFTRP